MGFVFRSRKRIGKGSFLNLSRSGASVSQRVGRASLSSRGRGSIRLLKGLSYRLKLLLPPPAQPVPLRWDGLFPRHP